MMHDSIRRRSRRPKLDWPPSAGAVALALLVAFSAVSPAGASELPGKIVLYDLLTEKASRVSEFYAGLFGWEMERTATGNLAARLSGKTVAGINEIENTAPDVDESTWLVGIEVADLEGALGAVEKLGGKVFDRGEAEGAGRWAIIEDPQGAQLGLIESERELTTATGPGTFVWAELWTDDTGAAARFYGAVVGYERSAVDRSGADYAVFLAQGQAQAGLVAIGNGQLEPGWAVYIGVENLAEIIARAVKLGGRVLLEPSPEVSQGRVAVLEDPAGVDFFVYQID